ncbi:hypothetical protein H8356DRAFT_1034643 [Neocallimastix lanati (nom. inval.)]|nr:hypothetical protein H8356DRAFT_1034643 [Neocallimastix sp. JGI-2020a]
MYYRCTNRIIPSKKTSPKDRDRIGGDGKNPIVNFINPVIFDLLILLGPSLNVNGLIIKLLSRYRGIIINNKYK